MDDTDRARSNGPPLEWMATVGQPAQASEHLGPVPTAGQVLSASLGLADPASRDEAARWLEQLRHRAEARSDRAGAALAGDLLRAVHHGWTDEDETAIGADDPTLVMIGQAGRSATRAVTGGALGDAENDLLAAIAGAQVSRAGEIETLLQVLLAHGRLLRGDADQVAGHLDRLADAGCELPAVAVLAASVRGAWLAAIGDPTGAARVFAGATSVTDRPEWERAVLAAFAAEALAGCDPERVAADGGDVAGVLEALGLAWAAATARRGAARALASLGRPHEAAALLGRITPDRSNLGGPSHPLAAGRQALVQARIETARNDRSAAMAALERAVELLDAAGADLLLVEALLALGSLADDDQASAALGRADELSSANALFDELWSTRPPFRVTTIGAKQIAVGDVVLELSEKPEQLVLAVLLAGEPGAHWETVATWLWPDEIDMGKLKSRISSTTNLARKALGTEGWRIVRDGPLLHVRRRGLELDVDLEKQTFDRTGEEPTTLEQPLLPMWSGLEWVEDAELRRNDLRR